MTHNQSFSTKRIIITGMFTAIISVMSQIVIPTQPIPFTLSLLAIFLTGALLEPKYAFLSAIAYLLLGTFGLPIFAGFRGGLHVLTGVTGGFIMAYPLMALITSISYQLSKRILKRSNYSKSITNNQLGKYNKFKKLIITMGIPSLGMVISLMICYLIGSLWFSKISSTTIASALTICVFPFMVLDILKIAIAVASSVILRGLIRQII
jgi:biotin transport system substrate-specific component